MVVLTSLLLSYERFLMPGLDPFKGSGCLSMGCGHVFPSYDALGEMPPPLPAGRGIMKAGSKRSFSIFIWREAWKGREGYGTNLFRFLGPAAGRSARAVAFASAQAGPLKLEESHICLLVVRSCHVYFMYNEMDRLYLTFPLGPRPI